MSSGKTTRITTLVYNPYFAALGGGEVYISLLALEVAIDGPVTLLAPVANPRITIFKRFGLDLTGLHWLSGNWATSSQKVSRLSRAYDRFICLTLGNPPINLSRHGILVIQFPYGPRPSLRVLASYRHILCYSRYCQEWIRRRWGIDALVLNPAIPGDPPIPTTKENYIVSIGRFQRGLNDKCFPDLIQSFLTLPRDKMGRWEYHIIGGTGQSPQDRLYLEKLQKKVTGTRVYLHPNLGRSQLLSLLSAAKLYWHAAGYGQPHRPEAAEHFGISIVEALAAGAVPLVYKAGGPVEVVEDKISGLHWQALAELQAQTLLLAENSAAWLRLASYGPVVAQKYTANQLRRGFRVLLRGES